MKIVYGNSSPLIAGAARDHLASHGILAAVIRRVSGVFGSIMGFDVILCYDKHEKLARTLLDDQQWWFADDQSLIEPLPDLSVLPEAWAPLCPACQTTLPLDAAIDTCPSCHQTVDIPELIVQSQGPEALADCYELAQPVISEQTMQLIDTLDLLCPGCQYSLMGLDRTGLCPECGEPFDKDTIVRQFMDS